MMHYCEEHYYHEHILDLDLKVGRSDDDIFQLLVNKLNVQNHKISKCQGTAVTRGLFDTWSTDQEFAM